MKSLMTLCALTLSAVALAQDKKTQTQNCERTKAYVLTKKELCVEETRTLQNLDCADRQASAKVDLFKLTNSCLKKKRPSKDGGTEHEET